MDLRTLVANLRRDADALESIDRMLRGLDGNAARTAGNSGKGHRKGLSAKARAAISKAQKARWAKVRAGKK